MKELLFLLPFAFGCTEPTGTDRDRFTGTWDMIVSYSGDPVPDTTWHTPDYALVLVSATLEVHSRGDFRAQSTHVYQELSRTGVIRQSTTIIVLSPEIHGDTLYLYPINSAATGAQPDKLVLLPAGTMNTVCRGIYHSDCKPEPILWRRRTG
jgi:hypothetical protein